MRTRATVVIGAIAASVAACGGRHRASTNAPASAAAPASDVGVDVAINTRHEVVFDVPERIVEPDDVRIDAAITSPSGNVIRTGGFPFHGRFKVRFTPREPGAHRIVVAADGGRGMREVARTTIVGTPSAAPGFVRVDRAHPHRLVRDDDATVFVLGENRINVYDPTWNHEKADIPTYLQRMASYGMSTIRVFLFADCESETTPGGHQIGCLEKGIGRFDETTADAIDTLFDAAEMSGIDVVLVANAIGFTPAPETWRSWDDNPYSAARGGPASSPVEFFRDARFHPHAARKLRYIADRWASSPRLLAIDLLNEPEWDGPIGERTWIGWAERMSRAWRAADPYGHLVTAGPVGLHWNLEGDERPWYASGSNDLVQWHLYGKEFYDPHALALEMARKVSETWSFGKPVVCGEFAHGGEDKASYDHTHDGIWSLLFSGAGALAHTAPPFELDSDEPMTPERGAHFRVLADLLRSFGPKTPLVPSSDVAIDRRNARVLSLVAEGRGARALWVLDARETYGSEVVGAHVRMPAPPRGHWTATWLDDATGRTLATSETESSGTGEIELAVPAFRRHVAARLVER